jgi:hypothetical protein
MAIDTRIRHDEAQRRELTGKVRNEAAWNGCIGHQVADVRRTGAAKCHQDEIARIETLFGQNAVERTDHIVVGDLNDRKRGLFD